MDEAREELDADLQVFARELELGLEGQVTFSGSVARPHRTHSQRVFTCKIIIKLP